MRVLMPTYLLVELYMKNMGTDPGDLQTTHEKNPIEFITNRKIRVFNFKEGCVLKNYTV